MSMYGPLVNHQNRKTRKGYYMEWYKTLSIHQKINLKDCCKMICGMTYERLRLLFSMKEIIHMLHIKLRNEGFEV